MAFSSQRGQPSQKGQLAVRLVCLSCEKKKPFQKKRGQNAYLYFIVFADPIELALMRTVFALMGALAS